MLGAMLGFSWGFSIVRLVALPGPAIAGIRLALGGGVLALVALALRARWPDNLRPVAFAGLSFGIHQLLYIAATKATSIAIVTLFGALQPLLVSMVSRRAVAESVPPGLRASALVALIGVLVVIFSNLDAPTHSIAGDVLSALNLLAFISYFLFAKRARLEGAPALTLTAAVQLTALLVVLPALLVTGATSPESGRDWALLAALALLPGNGHLLLNWAHPRVNATLASVMLSGVPLLASLWPICCSESPTGPARSPGCSWSAWQSRWGGAPMLGPGVRRPLDSADSWAGLIARCPARPIQGSGAPHRCEENDAPLATTGPPRPLPASCSGVLHAPTSRHRAARLQPGRKVHCRCSHTESQPVPRRAAAKKMSPARDENPTTALLSRSGT